ncbi:unnamed protein product, partial [Callosobruchus maculatus]
GEGAKSSATKKSYKQQYIYLRQFNTLADTCNENAVELHDIPSTSNSVVSDFQTYEVVYNEPLMQHQDIDKSYHNSPVCNIDVPEQELPLESPSVTEDSAKLELVLQKLELVIETNNKLVREFAKFRTIFEIAMKSKENDHTNIVIKSVCPLQLINSLEERRPLTNNSMIRKYLMNTLND